MFVLLKQSIYLRIKLFRVKEGQWKIVDFDRFLEGNRLIYSEAEASKLYKAQEWTNLDRKNNYVLCMFHMITSIRNTRAKMSSEWKKKWEVHTKIYKSGIHF